MIHYVLFFFFFFSSRRRHTRLQGDWSSDVCSSDLLDDQEPLGHRALRQHVANVAGIGACAPDLLSHIIRLDQPWRGPAFPPRRGQRSEEGRVGEKGRFRGWPDPLKKKKNNIEEKE